MSTTQPRTTKCRFCNGTEGPLESETVDHGHRAVTRFNRGDGRQRYVKVWHHKACRDGFERRNAEGFWLSQLAFLDEIDEHADDFDAETAARMREMTAQKRVEMGAVSS